MIYGLIRLTSVSLIIVYRLQYIKSHLALAPVHLHRRSLSPLLIWAVIKNSDVSSYRRPINQFSSPTMKCMGNFKI